MQKPHVGVCTDRDMIRYVLCTETETHDACVLVSFFALKLLLVVLSFSFIFLLYHDCTVILVVRTQPPIFSCQTFSSSSSWPPA
jgi:hypothetical protein